MITINIDKARAITKDRLRTEREPLLAALDVQFQRNIETNTDNTSVVLEKKRLRDITELVDNCTSLNELKNLSCLN